ncbi:MAG: thioredoxin domain-containing protein [Candidatus Brocadiales bacterium]
MDGAEQLQKKVNWYEWNDETFKLAQELDKPILLDIGAVWCHWCHVMEELCYANPEIIDIINEHFIAIQVDNDKRPDINERYNMGGWPTTAFLLPTGEFMLYKDREGNIIRVGGTFFPPKQFKGLLLSISNFYKEKKEMLFSMSKLAAQAHKDLREIPAASDEEVTSSVVDEVVQSVVSAFDETDAGFWFGRGNKFPHPAAVELALMKYQRKGDKKMLDYATRTLDAMASGGMYDHLWGGFHRYSVTPDWRIPHFEKMSLDNALILQNYLHAYQATGNEYYKKVAEETVSYVNSVMSDHVNGGFYGSQDADVGPDDDGSYFTWSEKQVRDLLSQKEAEVIIKYFGIDDNRNAMHKHPEQRVLNISHPPEADEHKIEAAMEKMRKARAKIKAPFVDRTVYTDWNAMMITSFLEASVVLNPPIPPLIKGGERGFKEFALKTIDFLLEHCYEKGKGMYHYYDGKPHVAGLLTDQANMANCLIDAYQVTGDNRYLEVSQELAAFMVENFIDKEGGGFFDTAEVSNATGALQQRVKNLETNAVASDVLMKLYYLLGDEKYKKWARSTILAFSGQLNNHGFLASRFGLSIDRFLNYPLQITVVGSLDDKRTKALAEEGLKFYEPGKIVEILDPKRDKLRIEKKRYPITDVPTAYVCIGTSCIEPIIEADKLSLELKVFMK